MVCFFASFAFGVVAVCCHSCLLTLRWIWCFSWLFNLGLSLMLVNFSGLVDAAAIVCVKCIWFVRWFFVVTSWKVGFAACWVLSLRLLYDYVDFGLPYLVCVFDSGLLFCILLVLRLLVFIYLGLLICLLVCLLDWWIALIVGFLVVI